MALSREQIDNLLHFGDDLYRAISVLPGTSGGDFSSAFNVRGGFNRENLRGIAIGDPHYHPRPDGSVEVLFPVEAWLPILPSFGVSYRF